MQVMSTLAGARTRKALHPAPLPPLRFVGSPRPHPVRVRAEDGMQDQAMTPLGANSNRDQAAPRGSMVVDPAGAGGPPAE